jgi:hypothetical protein
MGMHPHGMPTITGIFSFLPSDSFLRNEEKIYLRKEKIYLRKEKIYLRKEKIYLRKEKIYLRKEKIYLRKEKIYLRKEKILFRTGANAPPCNPPHTGLCYGRNQKNADRTFHIRLNLF